LRVWASSQLKKYSKHKKLNSKKNAENLYKSIEEFEKGEYSVKELIEV